MNIKDLTALGLSEKEAQVYLALLELGKDTVQHISNKSGVNRATTYFILDALLKQGLASTFEQGKKTYYAAEPPSELVKIIEKQEEEIKRKNKLFQNILPELKSIYNLADEKPTVRFYEGKEGLVAMQDHFVASSAEVLYEIVPDKLVEEVFSEDELKKQRSRRVERSIDSKILIPVSNGDKRSGSEVKDDKEIVYMSGKEFPVTSDVAIYNDTVAIASLKGKLSGVMIESKEIADSLRSLFKLSLKGAKCENDHRHEE